MEQIEKDFANLFMETSTEHKIKLLRKLDPTKLKIDQLNQLMVFFRSFIFDYKLNMEYYGIIGSGGDRNKTINASTLASIVASLKIPVCKLGTIGITSKWGSTDLIKALGYKFTDDPQLMKTYLKNYGYNYINISALKIPYSTNLIKARRHIYKKGYFDIIKIIASTAHPCNPKAQVTGVYHKALLTMAVEMYKFLYKKNIIKTGLIVHNFDEIDELSNTSFNLLVELHEDGKITEKVLAPEDMGVKRSTLNSIKEYPDFRDQLEASKQILMGKDLGPKCDFVCLNAASILYLSKSVDSIKEGVDISKELLESGAVWKNFESLIKSQN